MARFVLEHVSIGAALRRSASIFAVTAALPFAAMQQIGERVEEGGGRRENAHGMGEMRVVASRLMRVERLPRRGEHRARTMLAMLGLACFSGIACSSTNDDGAGRGASGGGATTAGANGDTGTTGGSNVTSGVILLEGGLNGEAGGTTGGVALPEDPKTCAEATKYRTYVGCDYWPTVVANNVWSIFDFAVVVANGQSVPADVTVTGPQGFAQNATVAPGSLTKIYLPWVADLKGSDPSNCGDPADPILTSTVSPAAAYHLVSSVPVTAYQFSPLEYQGKGGPPGKDWSSCPGNLVCQDPTSGSPAPIGCFSFSNDASMLIPTPAMTGSYRVTGIHGWTEIDPKNGPQRLAGGYAAVTATADNTTVRIKVASPAGAILNSNVFPGAGPGDILTFVVQAGDVVEFRGPPDAQYDLSGSVILADKPVQVITGIPCIFLPQGAAACDHVEETVLPAETLGKNYFVTVPTGPTGSPVGHIVRIYGNVDGTSLTYAPAKPNDCPATIDAGQVVDCGDVANDFQVTGDNEFGVSTFMLGSTVVDPVSDVKKGDPSQSIAVAVEQYRKSYIFLAPDDFDVSYVDIVGPVDVTGTLDGAPLAQPFTAIGATGYGVARVLLGPGEGGAHALSSSKPVGIQVSGYGAHASYQYPGGLNLALIAPPPKIKVN